MSSNNPIVLQYGNFNTTDPNHYCVAGLPDWEQNEECLLTKPYIWTNWMGPLVINWLFSTLFLGILLCQTLNYFSTFKTRDRKLIVFTVLFIAAGNLASAGMEWALLYRIVVEWEPFGFFDPIKWGFPPSHVVGAWLLPAIIVFVIQAHFARSAYEVSRSRLLLIVISVIIFAGLIGGLGVSGATIKIDSELPDAPSASFVNFQQGMVYLFVTCDMVADLIMTTVFCYSLYKSQATLLAETPTRSLITTLIRHSISTCLVTTIVAIGVLAATVEYDGKAKLQFQSDRIFHTTMAHAGIQIVVPRIYSITYLFVLNARPSIRALSRRTTAVETELTQGILSIHTDTNRQVLSKKSLNNSSGDNEVHLAQFPPAQGIKFTRDVVTMGDELSGASDVGDSFKEGKRTVEEDDERVFGGV